MVLFGIAYGAFWHGALEDRALGGVNEFHSSGANKEPVALCNGQKYFVLFELAYPPSW